MPSSRVPAMSCSACCLSSQFPALTPIALAPQTRAIPAASSGAGSAATLRNVPRGAEQYQARKSSRGMWRHDAVQHQGFQTGQVADGLFRGCGGDQRSFGSHRSQVRIRHSTP